MRILTSTRLANSYRSLSTLLFVSFIASGCVSPRSVLFTDGPTMKEVLQGANTASITSADQQEGDKVQSQLRLAAHVNPREVVPYDAYTRDSLNEINQLFPKLRNPTFALYINPHLSTSTRAPVPGYTTEFSLYDRDVYALPEEIPPNRYPSSEDLVYRDRDVVDEKEVFEPGAIVREVQQ